MEDPGNSSREKSAPKKFMLVAGSQRGQPEADCATGQRPCSSMLYVTERFVQGWAVMSAAEWMHLGEGHRAGDLYRCEGLKALVFQHGAGGLGGAPVSGEGMFKFDVLPQGFVLPSGFQKTS